MKGIKKMNYLIVMPILTKISNQSYYFPLGLAYVSSSLKSTGRRIVTYNLNYKSGTIKENLGKVILEGQIDVILTGGLTAHYWQIERILQAAREISPKIIPVVGGGIITSDPINAMRALKIADYGVIGEGEITIRELADAIEEKRDIHSVCGLIFQEDGKWISTPPRAEVMDLDQIHFPDYEGFEYEQTLDKMPQDIHEMEQGRLGYVSFGRSCPFNCTFCFHPSGTKYRRRSIKSVFEEIDYLIERYAIQSIVVTDELFVQKMEDLREFCCQIRQRNLSFIISLRVDMVNKEMLMLLKESGCISIGFGLESADNTILQSMNKHITIEQIENALALCEEVGIFCQGNFIFGDQAETVDTYTNTINWWKAHPQYNIRLALIVLYPGSELYRIAIKRGVIKDPVQFIKEECPYKNISKMTDLEYRDMALNISMLPQGRHGSLSKDAEIKVCYVGNGKANLTGGCIHCGKINTWENLDVFRSLRMLICKHCGTSINIVVCDYIDDNILKRNLEKIADKKTAIWPMLNAVTEFCAKIPEDKVKQFYFIDKSELKQGGHFLGNEVYAPSIIELENIDVVLVSLTSLTSASIIDEIKYEHPSVKHIYFLGDLIDENFHVEA